MKRIATLILASTLAVPMTYAQPAPPSVNQVVTSAELIESLKARQAELESLRIEARSLESSIKKQQKEILAYENGKILYVTAYLSLALLFYAVGRGFARKSPGYVAVPENVATGIMVSMAGIAYYSNGAEIKIHKDNIEGFQSELTKVNGQIDDEVEALSTLIVKLESI